MYMDFGTNSFARGIRAMATGAFKGAVSAVKRSAAHAAPATIAPSAAAPETSVPATEPSVGPQGGLTPIGGGMGKWVLVGVALVAGLYGLWFVIKKRKRKRGRK